MGDSVSTVKYQYPKPLSEVLDKSQKKSVEHCLKHTHSHQGFYFKRAPRDHAIEPFPLAVASKVMEGTVNPEWKDSCWFVWIFPVERDAILLGRSAVKPVVTQVEDSGTYGNSLHSKIPS